MTILPSKLIVLDIVSNEPFDYWSDPVNPDIWEGMPYKWRLSCSIYTQTHSSPNTPSPFFYNGLDVKVGDWIADSTGKALLISEIESQDESNVILIGTDFERFNTFNDPFISGFGGLNTFNGLIFSLNVEGLPDIQTLATGAFPSEAIFALNNRFQSRNILSEFVEVAQSNNGFAVGDIIKVDEENEGRYELCSADEINLAVGVVKEINSPKTDSFKFKPLTEIIENVEPPLVGNYGDIFYLDPLNPGKVTNVKPESNPKPVYIRLETETRAVRLNAIVDENSETISVEVPVTALDQTTFVLPTAAKTVQVMSINGIENKNFTFDAVSKVVTFDPIATGYGLEESDEVIFVYNT